MGRRVWIICLLLCVLAPAAGQAEIYTYVDASGKVFYTNVPPDARYRLGIRPRSRLNPGDPADFEEYVHAAARVYAVDPHLIRAVIKVESDFDHRAVSSKGAKGLMQLMPATAADMNVFNLFDPRANIMGGTCYLKKLLERFKGDLRLTLAAYNAGPSVVEQVGGVPNYGETQRYIRAVLFHYNKMKTAALPPPRWAITASN